MVFSSLLLALSTAAAADLLPEDRGVAGLHQALKRLQTTARVLYVTAHPDDEDGGTITWLTRGQGVDVTLLSVTRGEAGANLVTSDFFDSLGALRTLEFLKAAQYYGCKIRYTTFADYGYSKNLAEAWRNWNRERVLADVVRIVRTERPHVILARWQGTARDGHGHHEAAGMLAQLAYEAAGDPARFPEQIRDGLAAWQPLKLYSNNRRENDDWTIRIDSGTFDPVLGRSYAQIARDGLRWQRSQGAGSVVSRPGPSVGYYKLLASRAGLAEKEASFYERIEGQLQPPPDMVERLALVQRAWNPLKPEVIGRLLADAMKVVADDRLRQKLTDAMVLANGIELEALVQPAQPLAGPMSAFRPYTTFSLATPGQTFRVAAAFHNRLNGPAKLDRIELQAPPGWKITNLPNHVFEVTVPDSAKPARAFWRRESVRELNYRLDEPSLFGQPLPPDPLVARAHFSLYGVSASTDAVVKVSTVDTLGVQHLKPLLVGPRLSVQFSGDYGVLPLNRDRYQVSCIVRNLGAGPLKGQLRINTPQGWSVEPASASFTFEKENEESTVRFQVAVPSGGVAGDQRITAIASAEGHDYRSAFIAHTFTGLDTLYLERLAEHIVRRVDVKIAPNLRLGYVTGTGDDVPEAIRQLGVPFDLLDTPALAAADLSRYSSILLGIRAYAARNDVKTHNSRLIDYVRNGGVLIVQYNTPEYDNNYGPYPYQMGRNPEEVSEENSPVSILDPGDPVFESPNRIGAADFEGWIEQRGSKFLTSWDSRYKPLLETHDTGQAPQKGGWLVARYGKGYYVYCAYSWYRQLPFAVPGAVRLFANLISLSAQPR
jgi:LmbE family N-acetylglucosaminyl deacetylase